MNCLDSFQLTDKIWPVTFNEKYVNSVNKHVWLKFNITDYSNTHKSLSASDVLHDLLLFPVIQ